MSVALHILVFLFVFVSVFNSNAQSIYPMHSYYSAEDEQVMEFMVCANNQQYVETSIKNYFAGDSLIYKELIFDIDKSERLVLTYFNHSLTIYNLFVNGELMVSGKLEFNLETAENYSKAEIYGMYSISDTTEYDDDYSGSPESYGDYSDDYFSDHSQEYYDSLANTSVRSECNYWKKLQFEPYGKWIFVDSLGYSSIGHLNNKLQKEGNWFRYLNDTSLKETKSFYKDGQLVDVQRINFLGFKNPVEILNNNQYVYDNGILANRSTIKLNKASDTTLSYGNSYRFGKTLRVSVTGWCGTGHQGPSVSNYNWNCVGFNQLQIDEQIWQIEYLSDETVLLRLKK